MTNPGGNSGSLGTWTNHPAMDNGTSGLLRNRASVSWGTQEDQDAMEEEIFFGRHVENSIHGASLDAARFVIGMELKHRADIYVYGEGTKSGSRSGDFSQDDIDKMSKGEKAKNCLLYTSPSPRDS